MGINAKYFDSTFKSTIVKMKNEQIKEEETKARIKDGVKELQNKLNKMSRKELTEFKNNGLKTDKITYSVLYQYVKGEMEKEEEEKRRAKSASKRMKKKEREAARKERKTAAESAPAA